jgi:hypothetical protein
MVKEPSHVKQLSLNHVCKIGLRTLKIGRCHNSREDTFISKMHCNEKSHLCIPRKGIARP